MFGEPWGYGDYGQFHMVVWIILAAAFCGGGRLAPEIRFFVMTNRTGAGSSAAP